MFVSEKWHQDLSDYMQFLFNKRFYSIKQGIICSEKLRNSGNYIYDYAHSFFGKDFYSKPLYWCHVIWGGTCVTHFKRILMLQKIVIRIIHSAAYLEHKNELFIVSEILEINENYQYSCCVYAFKNIDIYDRATDLLPRTRNIDSLITQKSIK